jgi:hypothetical protein
VCGDDAGGVFLGVLLADLLTHRDGLQFRAEDGSLTGEQAGELVDFGCREDRAVEYVPVLVWGEESGDTFAAARWEYPDSAWVGQRGNGIRCAFPGAGDADEPRIGSAKRGRR